MSQEPWYKDGLRFKCTGCGKCCTGGPGYVWVDADEIGVMAQEKGMTVEEFSKTYVRKVGNRYSLKEVKTSRGYDCIFLKDKECTLYGSRPTQCRTYPFWSEFLETKEAWENLKTDCEGIDHPEGQLYLS